MKLTDKLSELCENTPKIRGELDGLVIGSDSIHDLDRLWDLMGEADVLGELNSTKQTITVEDKKNLEKLKVVLLQAKKENEYDIFIKGFIKHFY